MLRSPPILCNPPFPVDWAARLLCPWDFPGKNTGAISSSRGSSWPRNPTRISYISCIGRQILLPMFHRGSPVSVRGVLNFWSMNKGDHGWVSENHDPRSCLQTLQSCPCARLSGETSEAFMMVIDTSHLPETRVINWRPSLDLTALLDCCMVSSRL